MFQHFIITPFSYRSSYHSVKRGQDPLRISYLEHRFKMFETTCLPSILSQSNPNFTWVFIIDPELPERFLKRLQSLTSPCKNVQFYVHQSKTNYGSTKWLEPFIHPQTKYIVSTELDDDDAIFSDFIQYIYDHVSKLERIDKLPPVKFFGCKSAVQWDFFHSREAPLGYQKPFADFFAMPISTGHSMCCKYPEMDLTIKKFPHPDFDSLYLRDSALEKLDESIIERVKKQQRLIKNAAQELSISWNGILHKDEHFHVFNTQHLQAVMINHFDNIQYFRIFTSSKLREPLTIENPFEGIAVDLIAAKNHIRPYKRSLYVLLNSIRNAVRYNPKDQRSKRNHIIEKCYRVKDAMVGVYRMPK